MAVSGRSTALQRSCMIGGRHFLAGPEQAEVAYTHYNEPREKTIRSLGHRRLTTTQAIDYFGNAQQWRRVLTWTIVLSRAGPKISSERLN
jgi:hypothetical protein